MPYGTSDEATERIKILEKEATIFENRLMELIPDNRHRDMAVNALTRIVMYGTQAIKETI